MNAREKDIIEFALAHLNAIPRQRDLEAAYRHLGSGNEWASGPCPSFEEITQAACYVACVTPKRCYGEHE
jgi:hypothetical protein